MAICVNAITEQAYHICTCMYHRVFIICIPTAYTIDDNIITIAQSQIYTVTVLSKYIIIIM